MKFNWGTGIALVYGLFAITMVSVVILSQSHDPGLVSKNYYNLDLNYQEHYNKKQNAANLEVGVSVKFDAVRQVILVKFPQNVGAPAGSIKCYRNDTVASDTTLEINTDQEGTMEIPARHLTAGLWNLEIDWQADGTKFFNEALVTIIHA
ncbi:MAG: hypothetical protein EP344_11820 [Bacteroidetes bacterium]|nr:MAG: hypothetical protein EP344_11820 [Bacteroidota bacterium]